MLVNFLSFEVSFASLGMSVYGSHTDGYRAPSVST